MVEEMTRASLVSDALKTWAPTYPRRVTRSQYWADNSREALRQLLDAESEDGNSPFVSVYSFPRGHTKNGKIPRVDTLFFDFDFEGGRYRPGSGDVAAWRKDLSHLLVRVRRVAQFLRDGGVTSARASLSGHKGVHLFIDFPPVEHQPASFSQFVNGMDEFADELIERWSDGTNLEDLDDYIDVTSSDLGRLCRVPNTLHKGATESFGEERYCVPVTLDELAKITPDKYVEYTTSPREVPWEERSPNPNIKDTLSAHIQHARDSRRRTERSGSTVNRALVSEYREKSNDEIDLDGVRMLTSDRPCVWRFYERDDKYQYGFQSHYMEMYCIRELIEHNVPIDVIKQFLDSAPEYDEDYSERRIEEIISRDYKRFTIRSILENAPEFCGYDDCSLCQRVIEQEDIPNYE